MNKTIFFILLCSMFFIGCKQTNTNNIKQIEKEESFNYQRFQFERDNVSNEFELKQFEQKWCNSYTIQKVKSYITYEDDNYVSYMIGDICFSSYEKNELIDILRHDIITIDKVYITIGDIQYHKVTDGRIIIDNVEITIDGYDI